ncbi:MAG: zinc finger domain-containing protein, partial [Caldimonas sp.]
VFAAKSGSSIFVETYSDVRPWLDAELLAKWARIAAVRAEANRKIEALRTDGKLGSSLQAEITVKAGPAMVERLATLGDDLRFVMISSAAQVQPLSTAADAEEFFVEASVTTAPKCERCWHYRSDVGIDTAHPTICGRCTANLFGAGEPRHAA